jgi:hypothetical protein
MAVLRSPHTYKCTIGFVDIYDLNYGYTYRDTMKSMGGEAYLKKFIDTNLTLIAY